MAKKQSVKKKRRVPKTVLRLPDLDQAKSAVLKRPSGIWAASSAFVPPSMIASGSNRRAESWALLPAGRPPRRWEV